MDLGRCARGESISLVTKGKKKGISFLGRKTKSSSGNSDTRKIRKLSLLQETPGAPGNFNQVTAGGVSNSNSKSSILPPWRDSGHVPSADSFQENSIQEVRNPDGSYSTSTVEEQKHAA